MEEVREVTSRNKGADEAADPEADEMAIRVNGEDRRVAPGTTVAALLDELELHPGLIVVEHNRKILDRSAYGDRVLEEGDRLELVHFVGGG